jgi:hypothetical protein
MVTIYGTGIAIAGILIVGRSYWAASNWDWPVIAICNTYTNSIGMNLANARGMPVSF